MEKLGNFSHLRYAETVERAEIFTPLPAQRSPAANPAYQRPRSGNGFAVLRFAAALRVPDAAGVDLLGVSAPKNVAFPPPAGLPKNKAFPALGRVGLDVGRVGGRGADAAAIVRCV